MRIGSTKPLRNSEHPEGRSARGVRVDCVRGWTAGGGEIDRSKIVVIALVRTIASGSSRVPRELKHITIGRKRNQLGVPE